MVDQEQAQQVEASQVEQSSPEAEAPQEPQEQSQEASEGQGSEEANQEASGAEGAEGETSDGEAGEATETQASAEGKRKRSNGYHRTIERLQRQVAEKDALLAQMVTRIPGQSAPAGEQGKEKTAVEKTADFISDVVKRQLAAEREAQVMRAQHEKFQKQVAETAAAHPDFHEALQDVAHIPIPAALNDAILNSEAPGEIMYSLASNPAELARISALPPLLAAREVWKLEAKASGSTPQKPKTAARPPAPPSKVGGSGSSTRSLDELPLSEYKRAYRSGRR